MGMAVPLAEHLGCNDTCDTCDTPGLLPRACLCGMAASVAEPSAVTLVTLVTLPTSITSSFQLPLQTQLHGLGEGAGYRADGRDDSMIDTKHLKHGSYKQTRKPSAQAPRKQLLASLALHPEAAAN